MLSHIGCSVNHLNLQRDFNIHTPPAKTLYDHWDIFKQVANSKEVNANWRAGLIYFHKTG